MTITKSLCGGLTAGLLFCLGESAAQTPVSYLRTDGVIGVSAGNALRQSARDEAIRSTLSLSERAVRGSQTIATSDSVATVSPRGFQIGIDVRSFGWGASAGTTRAGLPAAQHYSLSTYAGTPQHVDLLCRYRGTIDGFASAAGSVQSVTGSQTLIADGAQHSFWLRGIPLSLLASSVRVSVDAQCAAATTARVQWSIDVELWPVTRCWLRDGTKSCDTSGNLTGRILGIGVGREVEVEFTTRSQPLLPPTVATLLVSPSPSVTSKLPGFADPSCVLLTTAPIAIVSAPLVNGVFSFPVAIPPSLKGPLWFQSLLSRGVGASTVLASTNTIRLDSY